MKNKIILGLLIIIAIDHLEDKFFDRKEEGYTQSQVKSMDTLIASTECEVGDWLCEIDKHSKR